MQNERVDRWENSDLEQINELKIMSGAWNGDNSKVDGRKLRSWVTKLSTFILSKVAKQKYFSTWKRCGVQFYFFINIGLQQKFTLEVSSNLQKNQKIIFEKCYKSSK